jgi:hypothetical protein
METTLRQLQRGRIQIFLLNLAYFVSILIIGYALFVKNADNQWLYFLAVIFVLGYLIVVRPRTRKHIRNIRHAVLNNTTLRKMKQVKYTPQEGVSLEQIKKSGLIHDENPRSFVSRQHITGRIDGISVEMADVSFPIHEKGKHSIFSGLYLHLCKKNAECRPLGVVSGDLHQIQIGQQQGKILQELCSFIPGNCYLHMEGDHADLLLRGRFIDYRINPLLEIVEKTLISDPLPEISQMIQLFVLQQN